MRCLYIYRDNSYDSQAKIPATGGFGTFVYPTAHGKLSTNYCGWFNGNSRLLDEGRFSAHNIYIYWPVSFTARSPSTKREWLSLR